jgi:Tfp pilus assembly protein PilX
MSEQRRSTAHGDEGSALVIVLAFLTFVGLVVMATLSYAGSSFALSSTTRDIEERQAAADGGAKYAVARVVADALASCTGAMAGAPATNGYTPAVTCETRDATRYTYSTGWGVYITDANGQIATQSGGGSDPDRRKINGPVYNGSTANPWNLHAPLLVTNGGVLQRITSAGCVQDSRLTIQGTGSYACTPPVDEPDEPGPTQQLPSSPGVLPDRPATGAGDTGGCRVFEPGRYASSPQLLAQNYFRSGVYFFEHGIGDVSGKDILAGRESTTETAVMPELLGMPCAVDEPGGVQFIFGGDGFLFAHNGSRVEIHSMAKGDVMGTSIYRLDATARTPAPWRAYASTRTGLGNPVVQSGQGGDANMVVHGLVYLPGGALDLEGKQSDVTQVLGGVVAGAVRLQASASMAQPVQIHAGEAFTFDLYVITSRVADPGGKDVTVSVALRLPDEDPTEPIVYSWTVD